MLAVAETRCALVRMLGRLYVMVETEELLFAKGGAAPVASAMLVVFPSVDNPDGENVKEFSSVVSVELILITLVGSIALGPDKGEEFADRMRHATANNNRMHGFKG